VSLTESIPYVRIPFQDVGIPRPVADVYGNSTATNGISQTLFLI